MSLSDPASERGLLASICVFGADAYHDVADLTSVRSFTIDSNQALWRCIEHAFEASPDTRIDVPTILSSARALALDRFFEQPSELQHLRAILNTAVHSENGRRLAARLWKLDYARQAKQRMLEGAEALERVTGNESIDRIFSLVESPLLELSAQVAGANSQGPALMGEGAKEYAQHLMDHPRELMGISTGFLRYDRSIGGGIRPGSLDVIGARMKIGKTQVVDNIGAYIASHENVPVLNIDTEMTVEEHHHRVLANLSGVPVRDIETGAAGRNPVTRRKVLEAADRLKAMPYHYVSVIGWPFEQILATIRRWVLRTVGLNENGKANPCVVIYDYLKLTSAEDLNTNMAEHQLLGFICQSLKAFTGRYGVGCICFVQLNRDGIDREDSGAVSGSDRIAMYASSLTIFKKKTDEERAEASEDELKYTHKMIPVLSRHGEGLPDGDYINLQADYKHGRITEGPTKYELERGCGDNKPEKGVVVEDMDEVPFGQ